MTIENLSDLKAGHTVALKGYGYRWYRDEVLSTTERCIVVKSQPEMKFKKNNGFSTQKDNGYMISIVTQEIQDDWDRREYQKLIQDTLQNEAGNIPLEVIRDVTVMLLNQNQYAKSLYLQCLREMLSAHSASSENLKVALQLLRSAINQ